MRFLKGWLIPICNLNMPLCLLCGKKGSATEHGRCFESHVYSAIPLSEKIESSDEDSSI